MNKFTTLEDLSGKISNMRKLYETFTIDCKLLFLIYLKWGSTSSHLRAELLNLLKMCCQRLNR